ncbi:MAG: ABC transporter permease [Bacteroidetes bacterium GWA2_31_9b]|nr:MAG: ABC transporter permease [Bacteroidetes bacterium GWA2_31_9b]
MNTELFIARRIFFDKTIKKGISHPIVTIAIIGIALGLAVMILSVAIVTGFKSEISNKVIGFGSHIQIINYDTNVSYETVPINKNQSFYSDLKNLQGIKHVQVFATKAGILKTKTDFQGIVLKGVGSDFDWSFFNSYITEGELFTISDSTKTDRILISKYLADLLKLHAGDKVHAYFIQQPPRTRAFTVSGIYQTNLAEFDEQIALVDIGHIQSINNWTSDQISGLEVTIDDFSQLEEMTETVKDIAGFSFSSEGAKLRIQNIKEKYPQIFDWLNLTDLNVWVILIIITLVAGFNMVSGLLILILERTNMIGILKAVGTNNWSIRKIFLYQSGFLITKGLIWGNIVGIAICILQSQFQIIKLDPASYYLEAVPINLKLWHILALNVASLIITVLMLVVPSYIISRLSPEKTIRFN